MIFALHLRRRNEQEIRKDFVADIPDERNHSDVDGEGDDEAKISALGLRIRNGRTYPIWVKGTIRAMWYGTVTRAWAKQHHRGWYRQVTGK